MSNNNKLTLGAVASILIILGIFFVSKNNQKAPTTNQQLASQQVATSNNQELDLKAQSSDFLIDFFVDGLAEEEYTTTNENIETSFTPYELEATGVISTNF